MRATSYELSAKDCVICGENFVPQSSKSMVCDREHLQQCAWCGSEFSVNIQRWKTEGLGVCCSNSCSTAVTRGSAIDPSKITEYREIDRWAVQFLLGNGQKPSPVDVQSYFGVGIPSRANFSLFKIDRRGRSGFESHVLRLLTEKWPNLTVLSNKRPPRSTSGKVLEIDLWIPDLRIGFEIQDLATHSRDSDTELSPMPWSELKKGPSYHLAKKEAADRAGIELFEIWEDDILTGGAQAALESAIVAALCASDEVSVP